MSLPQKIREIFRHKQASYKMVLMISLLKSVDDTGKAPLDKVVEYFRGFYEKRVLDRLNLPLIGLHLSKE